MLSTQYGTAIPTESCLLKVWLYLARYITQSL